MSTTRDSSVSFEQTDTRYDGMNSTIEQWIDEHVAFDPVQHTHAYEDVPEFDLQAYSVEEIFAEKLRAIYQRGAARDYYDLYQLLETDSVTIDFAEVQPPLRRSANTMDSPSICR